MIAFPEEIILVLEFRQNPAIVKLNRGAFSEAEFVPQIRRVPVLDDFAPIRQRREHPGRLPEFVIDRDNKRGVMNIKDCRKPIQKL